MQNEVDIETPFFWMTITHAITKHFSSRHHGSVVLKRSLTFLFCCLVVLFGNCPLALAA